MKLHTQNIDIEIPIYCKLFHLYQIIYAIARQGSFQRRASVVVHHAGTVLGL